MCSTPTRIDTRYQITIEQDVAWGRRRPARTLVWRRGRPARTQPCAPSRGRRHLPRTQHRPITNAQASRPHSPWGRGRPARTQRCAPSRGREHHVLDRPVRMSPLAPYSADREQAPLYGAYSYTRCAIRRARLAVMNVTRNAIPSVITTLIAAHLYERVSL